VARVGRYRAAIASVVVGLAASAVVAASKPKILKQLVLDDFEAPPGTRTYAILDETLAPSQRGRLEWTKERCRRAGAAGHCMHLRYAFDPGRPEQVSFRIDLGDLDASDYDAVEFWVKPDPGSSPTLKLGFRRPHPERANVPQDGTTVIDVGAGGWRRVVVRLNRMSGIAEWKHVRSVFFALESRRAATAGRGGYWIDDVALLKIGGPGPTIADEVRAKKKAAWVASVGGPERASRLVRDRLAGWPKRLLVDKRSLPRDDREFALRLARDTWAGIAAFSDRENGLPVDHVTLSASSLEPPASQVSDYTNVTNVGLHLMATVAARDLSFLTDGEATDRVRRVLDTLDRLEAHEGFFFNYYDTTTLERTSNFISFVDSSWLTAGLMVVKNAMPAVADRAARLLAAQSYRFFYDDVTQQMSHGYYVNVPTRSEYHYGVLYTEARLGSLIALGRGDAPEDHWFALVRTYPPQATWQRQQPRDWHARTVRGHTFESGLYEWNGIRYVPSWGGSMFEALMPTIVVDEQRFAPKSLGRNGESHAAVQRRYATEELGYPVFGLSPATRPTGDSYGEYGVPDLGTLGYPAGAIAPYAAALAILVEPDEAMANLRRLADRYDAYGEYGFYDSVDPASGRVAHVYLALDQSMTFIALADALQDHCVQRYFAADPVAARALAIVGDEDFFH
jgi:hypothetical protein